MEPEREHGRVEGHIGLVGGLLDAGGPGGGSPAVLDLAELFFVAAPAGLPIMDLVQTVVLSLLVLAQFGGLLGMVFGGLVVLSGRVGTPGIWLSRLVGLGQAGLSATGWIGGVRWTRLVQRLSAGGPGRCPCFGPPLGRPIPGPGFGQGFLAPLRLHGVGGPAALGPGVGHAQGDRRPSGGSRGILRLGVRPG